MVWAGSVAAGVHRNADDLGDDAFFICNSSDSAGIADGVGSWRGKGVQSGVFARSIMTNTRNFMKAGLNPYDAVSVALSDWSDQSNYGSSTVIVAQRADDRLYVAQIGDSGLMIIRNNRIVFQSEPQEHLLNTPYQVGASGDSWSEALRYSVPVQSGDTIIMASDGLFSNVFPSHIAEIISQFPRLATDPETIQDMAHFLCDYALAQSENPEVWTPIAQRRYEAGLIEARDPLSMGGKPDDIAVVVGRIE